MPARRILLRAKGSSTGNLVWGQGIFHSQRQLDALELETLMVSRKLFGSRQKLAPRRNDP